MGASNSKERVTRKKSNNKLSKIQPSFLNTNSSVTATSATIPSFNNKLHVKSIAIRVWVAQCKLYSFLSTTALQKDMEAEGFQELFELRNHKEAWYPLGCYYYDQKDFTRAYNYFHKLQNSHSFAQYRLALMIFHGQAPVSDYSKALKYMTSAAKHNNPYAQYILGFYYQHGVLVKHSTETAKMWYKRSAEQGFAEAQTAIANLLINEYHISSSSFKGQEALNWLYKAKLQENASALISLGALHENGILVSKNHTKSIAYYRRAIKAPFTPSHVVPLAHYLLGTHYLQGTCGLEQDHKLALHHLTLAANLGHAPALRSLGHMYTRGMGVKKDLSKSHAFFEQAVFQGNVQSIIEVDHLPRHETHYRILSHYEKAAESGSLSAQLCLATILQQSGQHEAAFIWFEKAARNMDGKTYSILGVNTPFVSQRLAARLMVARYRYSGWDGVVTQDLLCAFEEFQILSDAGYTDAHYWLGACYEEGAVTKQDLKKAFALYMKSAQAGFMDGQFQVAYMLTNGIGVTKDVKAALPWFTKAAEQGHSTAQYSLGLYYEHGLEIVPRDLTIAEKWYTEAAQSSTAAMVRLANVLIQSNQVQDAVIWLSRAAEKGDVLALRELATLYRDSLLFSTDDDSQIVLEQYKSAFKYYQLAAEKEDPLSLQALSKFYEGIYNMGDQHMVVLVDLDMAISCLRKSIALENTAAALDLADLYQRHNQTNQAVEIYADLTNKFAPDSVIGQIARKESIKLIVFKNDVDENEQIKAYSWLKELINASKNDTEALELLGYCAEQGIGTIVDKEEAIQFYSDCLHSVNHAATPPYSCLYRLVTLHMESNDFESAYKYMETFNSFLTEEDYDDMNQIRRLKYYWGYLILRGFSTKKAEEGLESLSTASDEGEGDASYELGCFLLSQDYISTESDQEIQRHFRQGVEVGHAGCMRELALLLLSHEFDKAFMDKDYDGGTEILDLLTTAASLNDLDAIYHLGTLYESGLGSVVPQSKLEKALTYYLQAGTRHHESAMMKAGELLGGALGCHKEAIHWFKKASEHNLMAQIMLISYELQGFDCGLSKNNDNHDAHLFTLLQSIIDQEEAKTENEKEDFRTKRRSELCSRKNGLGHAHFILGQCFEFGRGTRSNLAVAIDTYQKSIAVCQHVDAMWRLGMIYSHNIHDDIKALEWFRRATEVGRHRDSRYQLGLFHMYGHGGLDINITVAKKYFAKAAEQGHPSATYQLARILWSVESDYIHAYELFEKAAQHKVAGALCQLGHFAYAGFYFHSICIVEQDHQKAYTYYCEAAQLGDPMAALMVGSYFEDQEDLNRALQWYEAAYRLGGGGLAELAIGKIKHLMSELDSELQEEAIVWFESAQKDNLLEHQSIFSPQVMVALYYLNGWGNKTRDPEKGFQMLLEIAQMGGTEAFLPLATCYQEGVGTTCDPNKASNYWEMAAEVVSD